MVWWFVKKIMEAIIALGPERLIDTFSNKETYSKFSSGLIVDRYGLYGLYYV